MSISAASLPLRRRAIDLAWLALLSIYVLAGTPLVPFHADEASHIYLTHDYAYWFIDGNPARIRYQEEPTEPDLQALRILNGSVARYVMGLGWHLAGYDAGDINQQWDWGGDRNYNRSVGHEPSPGLLLASRWASVALLVGSVWLLFAVGEQLGGRSVAYLATAYFALNPAVLMNGRRAMLEGSLLLTEVLVVLAGWWFLRRRNLATALFLGVAAGLALAAKHNNAISVVGVFAACALFPFLQRFMQRRSPDLPVVPLLLAVATALALVVFFVLNPLWWGQDPLWMFRKVLIDRAALLDIQVASFDSYNGWLDQFQGFLQHLFVVLPQYYEASEFGPWIADEIARYESSLLRGVSIGGSPPGAAILIALVALGGWALFRRRDIALETRWLIAVWAMAVLAGTWLLTPLEWQRYYLPVYPAIGLLGALGVTQVVRFARSR